MIKITEMASPHSCLNKAKDDEMLFVLLGRDPAAAVAIEAWCRSRIDMGLNSWDDRQIVEAIEASKAMRIQAAVWRRDNELNPVVCASCLRRSNEPVQDPLADNLPGCWVLCLNCRTYRNQKDVQRAAAQLGSGNLPDTVGNEKRS